MTNLFNTLTTDGVEGPSDYVGRKLLESGLYAGTIKVAYATFASASKAMGVTVVFETEDGQSFNETHWVTDREGRNYYTDKQGKKRQLPGFTTINDIAVLSTGKPLSQQGTAEKQVLIWDFDERKELPKPVPVLTGLTDKEITLGVVQVIENVNAKNERTGQYEPTEKERSSNQIDKVFQSGTLLTHSELLEAIKAKLSEEEFPSAATYHETWVGRNAEKTKDKRTWGKDAGGSKGSSAGGSASTRTKASLFKK